MIYFYATMNHIRGVGDMWKSQTLYLALKGRVPDAVRDKIRTHIQQVWEGDSFRPYVQCSNRRGDKRIPRKIHPQYEEIAKRIEHRFISARGKVVRYGHPDVTRAEWIVANVGDRKSMDYQKLMHVRKRFKYDLWYSHYKNSKVFR
jgi:hypothetical protein